MNEGPTAALGARARAAVERLVERAAQACRASTTVYVTIDPAGAGERADLIVAVGGADLVHGRGAWRERLAEVGSRAAKALVVVLPNAERLGAGGLLGIGNAQLVRSLWELGRVREHAYLVFPRAVEVLGAARGQVIAPDLAHAPVGAMLRRTAHLQAFVVDTAPRTPQARRRLVMAAAKGEPG
jgi:voltage-gated potassium channel Kch